MTAVDELRKLHVQIDAQARALAAEHAERIVCRRGCIGCCSDEITVFEIEAERIRQDARAVLAEEQHPVGRCAFLDRDGACRIYDARPYVCRTQGLPLRWIDEEAEAEYRDICGLNDESGPPIETLAEESCWTIGEIEERLRDLQLAHSGELRRVALRDLFEAARPSGASPRPD